MPYLYHWSPREARAGILRRGLLPRCPTAVGIRPILPEPKGHVLEDVEPESVLAVCLGTSPHTAWCYSAAWSGEAGDEWDLWEVHLADTDEVHFRPVVGYWSDEIRVANRIPKSRLWHVGTRARGRRRGD